MELCKLLPDTTRRMLTMQLRELEEDGVIERKVYDEVPPTVEYSISKSGKTLKAHRGCDVALGKELFRQSASISTGQMIEKVVGKIIF